MASIVKRKSKYSVVYDYTDENGNSVGKPSAQMQKQKNEKSKLSMSRTLEPSLFLRQRP